MNEKKRSGVVEEEKSFLSWQIKFISILLIAVSHTSKYAKNKLNPEKKFPH